ncbi:uncharacterized protein SAPINGB_P000299 [Magnusiomyces paraingens]|uniref:TauD/TfdA-like domain-containing protein n=1 Tax=Magnusiomyces paraingens TaxID=2606893 RepID=A0A5E8AZH0_9ASCO|nr:uncharacterized protein SAPINGB_P000299 [Saprochaete ingens]VVT44094.1 unnamed protein product [Saprochaete ingens]
MLSQLSKPAARYHKLASAVFTAASSSSTSIKKRALHIVASDPHSVTISGLPASGAPGDTHSSIPFSTTFPALFLRDACPTAGLRGALDPSSSQKTFSTGALSEAATTISSVTVVDGTTTTTTTSSSSSKSKISSLDNLLPLHEQATRYHDPHKHDALLVSWADGHTSLFPSTFLARYRGRDAARNFRATNRPYVSWDTLSSRPEGVSVADIPRVDYFDYMYHDHDVYRAVKGLHEVGLVFVENIPDQEDVINGTNPGSPPFDIADGCKVLVEEIGKRIGGYIKETFYGKSWNVVSVPEATNVAYTSVYLPLHMDLLYYESPPGVQLLHIVRNSTVGGESLFADSFAAAHHVYLTDKDAYNALKTVPLTFHYDNAGEHYYKQRPMVVEDPSGATIDSPSGPLPALTTVNYSPPFQGPLDSLVSGSFTSDQADALRRGIALFEEYINDPTHRIEVKMRENTCMLFLNRRILHARNQFDQMSGTRWFRGTYLDLDAYQSKLRTLSRRYESK